MEITSLSQLDIANGIYTYADYLLWKFKERVELLKGKIFQMSAPSPVHQKVLRNVNRVFDHYFFGKPCELYFAPFDVRIPTQNEKGDAIHTVVQPDLCVVCDLSKIDNRGCLGSPDLVVEILSPGNSKKEMKSKFELYQEAGVEEYWIIDPTHESVQVYFLENEKYQPLFIIPEVEGEITSVKFPNLTIHTSEIFIK